MSLFHNRNSSGLFSEANHSRNCITNLLRDIEQVRIIMMSITLG